ncbi:MAG: hypothetical protein ACK42D_02300 [Candidatus Paceibacteria bacterium]
MLAWGKRGILPVDIYSNLTPNKGKKMFKTSRSGKKIWIALWVERTGWIKPSNIQQPPYVESDKPYMVCLDSRDDKWWVESVEKWCKNQHLLAKKHQLFEKDRTVI